MVNTSCPVIFSNEGRKNKFLQKDIYKHLVVSITDRVMLKQQLPILSFASQFFKHEKKTLSLHQNYENHGLEDYAKKIGFEIFKSDDYKDFNELYLNSDIHFGNRVHAHLKCLSLGIPSFCTPFDLRQLYFSQSIGLPLIENSNHNSLKNFSFKNFLTHREEAKVQMTKFLNNIYKHLN